MTYKLYDFNDSSVQNENQKKWSLHQHVCRKNTGGEALQQWRGWTFRLPTGWWDRPVWMFEKHPVCYQKKEKLWGSAERESKHLVAQKWLYQCHPGFQWSERAGKMNSGLQWLWTSAETPQFVLWRFLNCCQAVGSTGARIIGIHKILYSAKPDILWVLNTAKNTAFWNMYYLCEPFPTFDGHFVTCI